MSNIYIQEPPSNGKVLLKTTVGDIDVELWAKETPKASRNFVQLCLEGYYDGTAFHRVVKDFIVQGGDPTDTDGGESIYGAPFKDEFHQRLRFVRRGLVAMANAGPHDNGSQFFFTMAATPELQNKHTIFGKVVGDTLFNMLKLQDVEVNETTEKPLEPHRIISTEVLNNPFDDIVPRQIKRVKRDKEEEKKVKSKSKATKNFSLLSFGDEAEDDEEQVDKATESFRGKSKSSHDLTDDPRLSSIPAVEKDGVEEDKRKKKPDGSPEDKTKKADTDDQEPKAKPPEPSEEEGKKKTDTPPAPTAAIATAATATATTTTDDSKKGKMETKEKEEEKKKKPSDTPERAEKKKETPTGGVEEGESPKKKTEGGGGGEEEVGVRKPSKEEPKEEPRKRKGEPEPPQDSRKRKAEEGHKEERGKKRRSKEREEEERRKRKSDSKDEEGRKKRKGGGGEEGKKKGGEEEEKGDAKKKTKTEPPEAAAPPAPEEKRESVKEEGAHKAKKEKEKEETTPRGKEQEGRSLLLGSTEDGKQQRMDELKKEQRKLQRDIKDFKKQGHDKVKVKAEGAEEEEKKEEKEDAEENDLLAVVKRERMKYKQRKKQLGKREKREDATLAMLAKFQNRLTAVRSVGADYDDVEEEEEKNADDDEEDPEDVSWMRHKLKFEDDASKSKVIDANVYDNDRYTLHDPRNPLTQRRRESSKKAMKDKH